MGEGFMCAHTHTHTPNVVIGGPGLLFPFRTEPLSLSLSHVLKSKGTRVTFVPSRTTRRVTKHDVYVFCVSVCLLVSFVFWSSVRAAIDQKLMHNTISAPLTPPDVLFERARALAFRITGERERA